jgi:hypothetical protein
MVPRMKLRGILPSAAVVLLVAATATAQPSWKDRQAAARLAAEGKALVKKGSFPEAAEKFREADGLSPSPAVKLDLARLLLELSSFREARSVAEACTSDKAQSWADKQALQGCKKLLDEISDRTPTLALSVFEPEAGKVSVKVDGEPVDLTQGPIPLDPGEHLVTATASGYDDFEKKLTLAEGDRQSVEISLTKTAVAAESGAAVGAEGSGGGLSPIPAYVSWGVGAVGLGLGIGFGIAAIQATNDVLREYGCEGNVCPQDAEDDLDTAKLNGNISTAGFVIGFAGIVAGTILFVFSDVVASDESDEKARVLPLIGPGYVGVSGAF